MMNSAAMSDSEYERKLDELDRLLNDPDVPMQPDLVWSLLAEISAVELEQAGVPLSLG